MPSATTTPLPAAISRLLLAAFTCLLIGCTTVDIGGPRASKNDPAAGILTLPEGQRIAVLPEELHYTGEATFTWPDGRQQSGQWLDGALHGLGVESHAGERYSGQWHRGQRHGHGELQFADGSRYVGDFAAGLAEGRGTWTSDASMYQGTWLAGRRHGEGQYNGGDGSIYQGQWQQGQREGFGRQHYAAGGVYEGDWQADEPHGFGRFLFPTGALYEGSWQDGARNGYGTWRSPANLIYEGTWRNDQRAGFGRELRPDGSYYAGQWLADTKHGSGREVHPDGSEHRGEWQQDHILGEGTRANRTGIVIRGHWRGNSITHGALELPGGAVYQGALFSADGTQAAAELQSWLLQQAQRSNPHAQYFLASLYLDFTSPTPDPAAAMVWLKRAATAGVAEAQYRLSMALLEDDRQAALAWLQQAANASHPSANERLGEYYHTGTYLPRDLRLAMAHYEDALAVGSIAAANNLAWLLATARDTLVADPERAIELIEPFVLYLGDWQHLDTLAAAHARLGDTQRASRMQSQALIQARSLASEAVLDEMSARLALYNSNQAYLE